MRQFQGNRIDHQQLHPPPGPPPMKTSGSPRAGGDQKQDVATSKDKGSSTAAKLKAFMKMTSLLSPASKTSTQHPAVHPPWSKARVVPIEDAGGRLPGREGGVGLGKGQAVKMENKKGGQVEATERSGDRGGSRELEIQLRDNRGSRTNNRMRNAAVEGGGRRPEHGAQLPGFSSSVRSFSSDASLVIDGIYFTEASQRPPVRQKPGESLGLISLARRLQGPTRVGDEQWSDGRKMYDSIGEMSVSASVSSRRHEGRRWEKRDSETEQSDSETSSGSEESLSESSLSDRSSHASTVTAKTEMSESESGSEREDWRQEDEVSDSEEESGSDEETESSRRRYRGRSSESGSRNRTDSNLSTKDLDKHRHGSSNSKSSRYSSSKVYSSSPKTSRGSQSSHETSEQGSEENSDREEERKSVKSRKSSVSRRAHGHTHPDTGSGVKDASDHLWPIIEEQEKSSILSEEGREEEEEEGVWGNESTA